MVLRKHWSFPKLLSVVRRCFFVLVLYCVFSYHSNGQINEPVNQRIYGYLYRMVQKGLIKWNDYLAPMERRDILMALDSLSVAGNLSSIERKELEFYKMEYGFDKDSGSTGEIFFRKDNSGRFRSGGFYGHKARLFVDPVAGIQFLKSGNQSNVQYFSGVRLAGYFGKKWGFNFLFTDNTDRGDTLVHKPSFSSVEATVPTVQHAKLINYSRVHFNIGYRWSNGGITIGQEQLAWGYGLNGNIALSGRAPSYPFVRFDFRPWTWLHFNYFHGWLQSNIIDSARSYNTGTGVLGGRREVYVPKYLAHHSLTFTPGKGLDISIGESIVYSDQLQIAYLIPVSFFKVVDQYNSRYNIRAGDNSQFFGLISSRNHIPKSHLYAQMFIDEIRASKVLNRQERRNQFGYTLGINRTDLFIHYLTGGIEYSRINPFVYANLIPGQSYESQSYSLGDWIGNNADRLYLFAQYVPLPRLRLRVSHQKVRKGQAGSLQQQYFQFPQPDFLFSRLFDHRESAFSAQYEWINKLVMYLEWNRIRVNYVNGPSTDVKAVKMGISYGL